MRTILFFAFLLSLGAAHAAPEPEPEDAAAPTQETPKPLTCPVNEDSLLSLPEHGGPALAATLLEPLAQAGFPVAMVRSLVVSFRPYLKGPDAAFGVAEGPELAAAVAAWSQVPLGEEAHLVGEEVSFRLRFVDGRLHFSLGDGDVAPLLRRNLSQRPEKSLASRYPCMGDPDALYSLRVRRQRPRYPKVETEDGKPSGPIAWVRDYHLDLHASGEGLQSEGHFEIQMPLRGFLWPLFGNIGMQTLQNRLEGCADDLEGDPAGVWFAGIEYDRTSTGVRMRRSGPARTFDEAIPGLRRILAGRLECSRGSLPAALQPGGLGEPEEPAPTKSAPKPAPKPVAVPKPKAPRGWLW
jgi:hypothetical protein